MQMHDGSGLGVMHAAADGCVVVVAGNESWWGISASLNHIHTRNNHLDGVREVRK